MDEPILGMIQIFGFDWAPRGWARCDGQLLPIAQNQSLYSLLGTIYGGDGRTTFALPDLRGRAAMHFGDGPGLTSRPIGQKTGAETTTLNTNNLPSHTHTAAVSGDVKQQVGTEDPGTDSPTDGYLTSASSDFYVDTPAPGEFAGALQNNLSVTLGNTGNSQAFSNMQPYLTNNYCIALLGLFPSRN